MGLRVQYVPGLCISFVAEGRLMMGAEQRLYAKCKITRFMSMGSRRRITLTHWIGEIVWGVGTVHSGLAG